MAQPQAYNRKTDFTERDGDDTNHAGVNTELDAAALSINEIRDKLALIQRDDGALKNGIVTAESLSDSAFNAVLGDVATATAAASAAADRSVLFSTQSEVEKNAAQAAAQTAAALLDNFDDRYLGSKTTNPTTDNDGNPLITGALYFNSVAGEMRVWAGTFWKAAGSSVNGIINTAKYTATAGQTTFAIVYDVGFVHVYLNGVKLESGVKFTANNGTTVVLATGATAGDVVDMIAFGTFSVANTYTKAEADALLGAKANQATTYTKFELNAANGSSLLGFQQSGTGAVQRTAQDKMRETVSVKDFGAVGDGAANDTASVAAAVAYMVSTGNNVFVPPGIYLTDPFTINSQVYAGQACFIGADRERCVIKRRTTGAAAFVTYGSVTGTVYQSGIGFAHLTIDGGASTNGDAFVGYDVVRSSFDDVHFKGGAVACHLYGGISLSFYSCLFDFATIGLKVENFTSSAGGGWPNIIRVVGGEIVDNTSWGAWFDGGRMFVLDSVEVEGNGTTLASAQGGVYIGPNVGAEVAINDTYSIGLVATKCWFEANKGTADVSLNNGVNAISDSNFFSQSTQVTNDIQVNGGRYTLRGINISFSKTANVLENSGTVVGNVIESSDIPNLSVNASKTIISANNKTSTRNGVVPVFYGYSIPFEQSGNNNISAGTTISITFSKAFASAPLVFTQVSNGDTSTQMINIVISSVSTTGFTARALSLTNGSSAISSVSAGFNWRAVGTL